MRAVAVSLLGASIFDESRAFKRVLYSVSSESYCDEVRMTLTSDDTENVRTPFVCPRSY